MTNRKFLPYQGFGDIQFGDYYLDVRKKLDSPFEQVYFDEDAKWFSDHFDDLGFKVEYDLNNKVVSIEVWTYLQHEFVFLEKNLTPLILEELTEFINDIDEKAEPFSIGIYSPKYGISICSNSLEDDEPASSFHVIREDYMTLHQS
ncbi:MAG: hypothetical protein RLZZ546_390 [Bacteroidota bacterium]|jgi:hypothetical protein